MQRLKYPPADVLDRWLRLFGGDLLAFSAAVTRRAPRLVRGDFTLLAEDAREYISREYLDGLNSSELNAVRVTSPSFQKLKFPERCLVLEDIFPSRRWIEA